MTQMLTPVEQSDFEAGTVVADEVIASLLAWGVTRVFTCPGSTEAAFLHAAAKRDDLQVHLTTHESIAVSMADGHARATGRPAVAYLHANVGLTNGLSHLYAAQLAHSPVMVLTGLKQTAIQGRGGFTTAPHIRDFVRQYSKWTWQSLSAETVGYDVNRALQVASTAPQGPTWVGLSQDVVERESAATLPAPARLEVDTGTRPSRDLVRRVATKLRDCKRRIIVAGTHLGRAPDGPRSMRVLTQLAEMTGAAVFAENRRGFERFVFPSDHAHYAGMYDINRPSVADADLVLIVGARCFTEFEAPVSSDLPPGAHLVHTHPDPAEVAKIHGADEAVACDSLSFVEDLVEELQGLHLEPGQSYQAARAEQLSIVAEALSPHSPTQRSDTNVLTVPTVMGVLADHLGADDVVVGDATTSGEALIHAVEQSAATMHTTSSGSLGWGVGAALGIQLAQPNSRVIAVCGDGAFQFGIQGLWTAVRYNIPVTFVVVNNQSYAAVGAAIRRYAGDVTQRERALTVDLAGPNLAAAASAFGLASQRVTTTRRLADFLGSRSAVSGPALVEVMTNPRDLGP